MSAENYSVYPDLVQSLHDWELGQVLSVDGFLLASLDLNDASPVSSVASFQSPLSLASTLDGTEHSSAPTSPGSYNDIDLTYENPSYNPTSCHVPPVQYISPSLLDGNCSYTYPAYPNSPQAYLNIVGPLPQVATGPFSLGNTSSIASALTPPVPPVEPPVSPLSIQGLSQLSIHDDNGNGHVSADSDEDAEGSDDDEYLPSPRPAKARRRNPSSRASTRSASSSSPPTSRRGSPAKKSRVPPPSRNYQVRSRRSSPLTTAQEAIRRSYMCPVCHFTQNNRRLPDLDRHIRTHYRNARDAPKCMGVPLARAAEFGLDPADAEPGATHIGGCWMTFARTDALKRHLHNPNTLCVGMA